MSINLFLLLLWCHPAELLSGTHKKQRFKPHLGARPVKTKTSWVNKLLTPFIINTPVPDFTSEWRWSKGLVVYLAFSLLHVHKYWLNPPEAQKEQMWCFFSFFLTGDIPLRKHSSNAALSAHGPSAALRTSCAVSLSVDESPGASGRRDECETRDECKGQGSGRGALNYTLYLRCLADKQIHSCESADSWRATCKHV